MAKQMVTLYVHTIMRTWATEPELFISGRDMSSVDDYTLICTREAEIDIPEYDTRGLMIESLKASIKKERADSQSRVNILLDRISKLKCLTHEVPV
jgi:hypothetical protein